MDTQRLGAGLMAMAALAFCAGGSLGAETVRLPASAHNLLVDAKTSGNLESYKKGLRGRADHVVYDLRRRCFVKRSQWHEYGVGFGQDLGVVREHKPAFWLAEWQKSVRANLIVLSGVYPNQPQPQTCWKIELRRDGKWAEHARGKGGWYNAGRYVWGGAGAEPIAFDALRVSVFSPDDTSPIKSIHFRGEEGVSWVVALLPPIDARIQLPGPPVRAGQAARFAGQALAGKITKWQWDFGDGQIAQGRTATHTFDKPGDHEVTLTFSGAAHTASVRARLAVASPVEARIVPLMGPVVAGKPVELDGFTTAGKAKTFAWDFGDGQTAARLRQGEARPATAGCAVTRLRRGEARCRVRHTFAKPGIYRVKFTASDGRYSDACEAIVRAHTPATLHVPQVFLDTDQKNEQDDQHYFGYGLFSQLDLLGVNSVHHGGGQEPINYREILHVLDLAKASGLPKDREPLVFHGANKRLDVPAGGNWADTQPIVTEASEAILAAARGASPTNPVWVVPVGPGTNAASAILQARAEGLKLKGRVRVMWLGGSNDAITREFNGNNDPWSMYVVAHSGLETWIMPAPVGARVRIDKRTEADLYADHPLGRYLLKIMPARNKALYDPSCLSAIISLRLGLGWVKVSEPVTVAGPKESYRWTPDHQPTAVRVIRQIDQAAMKADIFNTMKHKPHILLGAPLKK